MTVVRLAYADSPHLGWSTVWASGRLFAWAQAFAAFPRNPVGPPGGPKPGVHPALLCGRPAVLRHQDRQAHVMANCGEVAGLGCPEDMAYALDPTKWKN